MAKVREGSFHLSLLDRRMRTGVAEQGCEAANRRGGILPNQASVIPLAGAVLAEQHDDWQVSQRCFSAGSLSKLCERAKLEPMRHCRWRANRTACGNVGGSKRSRGATYISTGSTMTTTKTVSPFNTS